MQMMLHFLIEKQNVEVTIDNRCKITWKLANSHSESSVPKTPQKKNGVGLG